MFHFKIMFPIGSGLQPSCLPLKIVSEINMTLNLAFELILVHKGGSILPLYMLQKYCGSFMLQPKSITKVGVPSHHIVAITLNSNKLDMHLSDTFHSNLVNVSKEKFFHTKCKRSLYVLYILHSSYIAHHMRKNELVDGISQQCVLVVNKVSSLVIAACIVWS